MTRLCVEYIIIDPSRMEDGQRLIILNNLPQKWFDKIERIDQHDRVMMSDREFEYILSRCDLLKEAIKKNRLWGR